MALAEWYDCNAARSWVRNRRAMGKITKCYSPLDNLTYYLVHMRNGAKIQFDNEDDAIAFMQTMAELIGD